MPVSVPARACWLRQPARQPSRTAAAEIVHQHWCVPLRHAVIAPVPEAGDAWFIACSSGFNETYITDPIGHRCYLHIRYISGTRLAVLNSSQPSSSVNFFYRP